MFSTGDVIFDPTGNRQLNVYNEFRFATPEVQGQKVAGLTLSVILTATGEPELAGEVDAGIAAENVLGRTLNSKGVEYPTVSVEGFGEVPFPEGPFTPNNSQALRSNFTQKYKADFKSWWEDQGKPWPTPSEESQIDIHHVKPLKFGGTNDFENLVPLDYETQHKLFTGWWAGYKL